MRDVSKQSPRSIPRDRSTGRFTAYQNLCIDCRVSLGDDPEGARPWPDSIGSRCKSCNESIREALDRYCRFSGRFSEEFQSSYRDWLRD